MSALPTSASLPSLRDALQSARQQHRAGAGAVLDILLRMPGVDAVAFAARLQADAGVAVMQHTGAEIPDFSAVDLPTARAWKCARQMVPTVTGGLVCTETAKRIDAERLARGAGARGAGARVRFHIDDLRA